MISSPFPSAALRIHHYNATRGLQTVSLAHTKMNCTIDLELDDQHKKKLQPLQPGSYIALPKVIKNKKACVN